MFDTLQPVSIHYQSLMMNRQERLLLSLSLSVRARLQPYRIGPGLVLTPNFGRLNGWTHGEEDDQ